VKTVLRNSYCWSNNKMGGDIARQIPFLFNN